MNPVRKTIGALTPAPVKRLYRGIHKRYFTADDRGRSVLEITETEGFAVAFRKHTADERVIASHSFANDIFFSALGDYRLPEDAVVIDVGAHIGTFSLLSAKKAPRGRVLAVEASRESYCLLRTNVALNRLERVQPLHVALSDTHGEVTLHHSPGNWGHSITKRLSSSSEVVPSTTLERLLADHGIDACQLVKFNCEGAEFPILMTTPIEVLRRIEKMIVLYHGDLYGNASSSELEDRLRQADFKIELQNVADDRGWILASRD